MQVIAVKKGNQVFGLFINRAIAVESIKISYSAFKDAIFTQTITSVTVVPEPKRDPIEYQLEVVEILEFATHL